MPLYYEPYASSQKRRLWRAFKHTYYSAYICQK